MLAEELDDMVKDYEQAVKRQARLSLEDYLRLQQKTRDDLRAELTPGAAARLRRALVLGEVIRLERLAVEEVEVGAAIEESSASWGIRADEVRASLNSDAGRSVVSNRLLSSKAVQRLVAIARGEAPELAPVEEAEERRSRQQAASK
jgi:FKBP-type peptidyl-prolyl cis-trans isomerase (trigger factor)